MESGGDVGGEKANKDGDLFAHIHWPKGTRDWREAVKGLVEGKINLGEADRYTGFTATKIPYTCRHGFVCAVGDVLEVIEQLSADGEARAKLFNILWLMPQLVLRVRARDGKRGVQEKIDRALRTFNMGGWAKLVSDLRRDGERHRKAKTKNGSMPLSAEEKTFKAEQLIAEGALGKARTLLTSAGFAHEHAQMEEIVEDLQRRNPQAQSGEEWGSSQGRGDCSLSREDFLKAALKAKAMKAPDQWGWREREYMLPLLFDEAVGSRLARLVLCPMAQGIMHLPNDVLSRIAGGKLFALSKYPKKGVRPIVVGDAVRSLVARTLYYHDDSWQRDVQDYFTKTHPRVYQFGVGVRNGAVTLYHLLALKLGGMAYDIENTDPHNLNCAGVISVDVHNAFNAISRSLSHYIIPSWVTRVGSVHPCFVELIRSLVCSTGLRVHLDTQRQTVLFTIFPVRRECIRVIYGLQRCLQRLYTQLYVQ